MLFFWRLFGYRIRDEEMRWRHQSEARHAFLKRDDILLVVYQDWNTIFIMKRNDWSKKLEHARGWSVHVFIIGFYLDTETYIADWSPPRTRSNNEMISYWVYHDCNIIFITKVILISREPDDTWVRKDGTHFFAGYSVNERINDRNQIPSVVSQQCRQSFWKRWFLLERWESIFIMEVNKGMKTVEVTRERASRTFLLDISIQQERNVCMVPFFPIGWRNLLMCNFVQGWWIKRFVGFVVYIYIRIGQKCTPYNLYICFHYESYIDEPRNWWQMTMSQEGRYTLFHWTFGYTDWINSTTR